MGGNMVRTLKDAKRQVPEYVEPRDCFVWFMSNRDGYAVIPGTPCAHYVAHQIAMKRIHPSESACKEGYLLRVSELVARLGDPIAATDVQVGDVWARLKHGKLSSRGKEPSSHCGIVSRVGHNAGQPSEIAIKHCSSGQRKVAENDWARHFHAGGSFYRVPDGTRGAESHANLQRLIRGFDYRALFTTQA
jgi:hypothetical protein